MGTLTLTVPKLCPEFNAAPCLDGTAMQTLSQCPIPIMSSYHGISLALAINLSQVNIFSPAFSRRFHAAAGRRLDRDSHVSALFEIWVLGAWTRGTFFWAQPSPSHPEADERSPPPVILTLPHPTDELTPSRRALPPACSMSK